MRQSLFTIAPDAPFLETLAERILDGTLIGDWPRTGPFWLADITILLPTRRAELALADAFVRRGQSLLPDIRALGDEDAVEQPFLPPIDLPALPSAMPALERRLVLARLIDAWARRTDGTGGFANPPSAAEVLWLSDSLAALLDDLTIARLPARALRDIAPEALAANWQQTLHFLEIVLTHWPDILARRGLADVTALRNLRLERQAATAPLVYGERPVIAAGSTGSVPATADLLSAISRLPRGAVVLPGLDTTLSLSDVVALTDVARAPHAHPQYGLVKLLGQLGARPDAVTELSSTPTARTGIVRAALAMADRTAGWAGDRATVAPQLPAALDGLAILAAPGEDTEARAIAVAARDALSNRRSVGIISPDRNLARRIAAELRRFDVEVDDAAGTPLFQSAAGRLARSILAAAVSRFAPVELMALLRNRATTLGLPRFEIGRTADNIELGLLRGQRPGVGLAGLRQALDANLTRRTRRPARDLTQAQGEGVAVVLDRLETALAPLSTLLAAADLDASGFAVALAASMAAITARAEGDAPQPLAGMDEFRGWAASFETGDPGPPFPPRELDAVLAALTAGIDVRPDRPARADIAIWGRLEARLLCADLMILAGLNEDVWPEPADPGPWLSRGMRLAAGLEPPERRQGQAAHDFEMAIGNRHTLLAFSTRRGASPALASPLLQRLEAYIGPVEAKVLRARGAVWLEQARRLDLAVSTHPAARPMPRPPAGRRPRQLSITEIETLIRSPYDIYARHVLKLRAMQPLGEEPGARDRGSMIHDAFGKFVMEGRDPTSPQAHDRLLALAEDAFAGLEAIGERRDIWLRRFERAAELFLAYERERQPRVRQRHAEIDGAWPFPLLDNFRLTGRADRIDEMADGSIEIIDFKTGGVPSSGNMKDFLAPQLPLEAIMVREGAFEGVTPAETAAMNYIKIGLGPEAFTLRPYALSEDQTLMQAADEMWKRLQMQVAAMLLAETLPMAAQVFPDPLKRFRGEFDHLARMEEWAVAEDDDIP